VLTAASAVPLGAAVLYAAGSLDGLPRLLLGAALIVLGVGIRRTEGTVTGARIGASTSRATGFAVVVGGTLTVGGGLASLVLDRSPGAEWVPLLLCAALAAAGAWVARERPAIGGVVVAVAVGVGWTLALELLGAGPEVATIVTILPAAALTVVAVRGRGPAMLRASVGTVAALLIVVNNGEALGVSAVLLGLLDGPTSGSPAVGWTIAMLVAGKLLLVVLLATAFVRRDPVGGSIAAAGLLAPVGDVSATLTVANAVIPAVALVALGAATWSATVRRWLTDRAPAALRDAGWNVSVDAARGASSVALVVCVASVWLPESRALAALAVAALLMAASGAWTTRGTAATVAAAFVLVGWATSRPLTLLLADRLGSATDDPMSSSFIAPTTAGALTELVAIGAVALVLAVRSRAAGVAAAGVYAVIATSIAAMLLGRWIDDPLQGIVHGGLTVAVVALVLAAGCAAVGPSRWLAHTQAVAATAAGVAMVTLFGLPTGVLGLTLGSEADPSTSLRAALASLTVGIAFGGALLAASTVRRTSTVAALGAVVAAVGAATLAATLSAALEGSSVPGAAVESSTGTIAPLSPVLGFDWNAGLLQFAAPDWPVIFGLVGVVLLAAATWLESRRPLPANAPLAPRDEA
jgi:hypothetical protein